ncbi:gustatory and pheromone receptor 39a [Culex quinquefasciatus]|uniref:gustatory and pheromone receptor 39a n=1 Tax=Culex quinquefasciatus TaxID=7176 RepID=UPI0018E2D223|nr:gustatory and pheromone receptor 39a [Culex quinquefasciatus]
MHFAESQHHLVRILTILGYPVLREFKSDHSKRCFFAYAIFTKIISLGTIFFHFCDPILFPHNKATLIFFIWFAESVVNQICMTVLTLNNIIKDNSLRKVSTLLEDLQSTFAIDCSQLRRTSDVVTFFVIILYFFVFIPVVFLSKNAFSVPSLVIKILYTIDGISFTLYEVYLLMLLWSLEKLIIAINFRMIFAFTLGKSQPVVPLLTGHSKVLQCVELINRSFGLFLLLMTLEMLFLLTGNLYCHVFGIWPVVETERAYLTTIKTLIWIGPQLALWLAVIIKCNRFYYLANETALCTRHFDDYSMQNTKVTRQINKFLLKNLHQKKKFSAYGFFDIDNSVIYTVFSSIVTYLVILIQFKQLENDLTNENGGGNDTSAT